MLSDWHAFQPAHCNLPLPCMHDVKHAAPEQQRQHQMSHLQMEGWLPSRLSAQFDSLPTATAVDGSLLAFLHWAQQPLPPNLLRPPAACTPAYANSQSQAWRTRPGIATATYVFGRGTCSNSCRSEQGMQAADQSAKYLVNLPVPAARSRTLPEPG